MPKARDLETQLHGVEHQLRLFQRISRHFARNTPLPDALRQIAGLVSEFCHSDSCLIYLRTANELVLCAASGPSPARIGEVRLRLDEGLTGWVARERRLLAISRDASLDPRFKFFRDLPEDSFEAFLSAPLIARGRVVGVINVQHRHVHSHSGPEMEVVGTTGELAGALVGLACLDEVEFERADYAGLALSSLFAALD